MNIFGKKFLVVMSALMFTACGSSSEEEVSYGGSMSEEGVLMEQEINDNMNGTHYLLVEGGEKVAVRSLNFNLSDDNYLGNEVRIEGVLNEDGVIETESIVVLEVNDNTEGEAELEVYSDYRKGVEFAYYNDFELVESGERIAFENGEGDGFYLEVMDFESAYEEMEGEEKIESTLVDYVNFELDAGISAEDLSAVGPEGLLAYKDGNSYYFYRNDGGIYKLRNNGVEMEFFGDTVSSFKFVAIEESADVELEDGNEESNEVVMSDIPEVEYELTGFESLPYSFKGVYPNNWYYAGLTSGDSGVLHRYLFGKEAIEDGNEIIVLNVLAGGSELNGEVEEFGGKEFYIQLDPDLYIVNFEAGNRSFSLQGPNEYKDLMLNMANGVAVELEN